MIHPDRVFCLELRKLFGVLRYQVVILDDLVDPADFFSFLKPNICMVALNSSLESGRKFERVAMALKARQVLLFACIAERSLHGTRELIRRYDAVPFIHGISGIADLKIKIDEFIRTQRLPERSNALPAARDLRMKLSLRQRAIFHGSQRIAFSETEFRILCVLLKRPNQLLTRHEILQMCGLSTDLAERNVDVHISKIRRKLNGTGLEIQTIRHEGYCFSTETSPIQLEVLD